jgi:polar amino acid transport system substrate-binding protein
MKRNLSAFLNLVNERSVQPSALGASDVPIDDAPGAYRRLRADNTLGATGILFRYGSKEESPASRAEGATVRGPDTSCRKADAVGLAFIGVGNFATGTLIPKLKALRHVELIAACSAGGLSAQSTARRHGFRYSSTDVDKILNDPDVDGVVIATRHDSHASLATKALEAGKSVFVEKPLALNREDLERVLEAEHQSLGILMPGFNRRFSGISKLAAEQFGREAGPLQMICRVNAGPIGKDSWYQDPKEGGWRIVSEGCHWIDLMSFFAQALPVGATARMIGGTEAGSQNDSCTAVITFDDGSVGTLCYFANGDKAYPKERIELFGQGKVAVIDNWSSLETWSSGKKSRKRFISAKGHKEELEAFVNAVASGSGSPICPATAAAVTGCSFDIQDALLS